MHKGGCPSNKIFILVVTTKSSENELYYPINEEYINRAIASTFVRDSFGNLLQLITLTRPPPPPPIPLIVNSSGTLEINNFLP